MKLEAGKEYWIKAKFIKDDGGIVMPYMFAIPIKNSSRYWVERDVEAVEVIPEREKVVVPKFVADWIEACKRDGDTLAFVLEGDYDIAEWLETEGNEELLARAYLDGYEIEKEPLYTVEIPNSNKIGNENNVLMMNGFRQVVIVKEYGDNWKKEKGFRLTESEIKKDFEWAWQWAEPVEE